jgi:hypothetical protein
MAVVEKRLDGLDVLVANAGIVAGPTGDAGHLRAAA